VRVIEHIEELGAELNVDALADFRVLKDSEVAAREVVAHERVASGIAVGTAEALGGLFGVDDEVNVVRGDRNESRIVRIVHRVKREVTGRRRCADGDIIYGDRSVRGPRVAQEWPQNLKRSDESRVECGVGVRAAEEELCRSISLTGTRKVSSVQLEASENFAYHALLCTECRHVVDKVQSEVV